VKSFVKKTEKYEYRERNYPSSLKKILYLLNDAVFATCLCDDTGNSAVLENDLPMM
jgi:hypothetical protein